MQRLRWGTQRWRQPSGRSADQLGRMDGASCYTKVHGADDQLSPALRCIAADPSGECLWRGLACLAWAVIRCKESTAPAVYLGGACSFLVHRALPVCSAVSLHGLALRAAHLQTERQPLCCGLFWRQADFAHAATGGVTATRMSTTLPRCWQRKAWMGRRTAWARSRTWTGAWAASTRALIAPDRPPQPSEHA